MRRTKNSNLAWIGAIPEDWSVLRGKNVVKKLKRPVKETDGVITCFRDGEVTLRSNRREEGFTFSDLEVGYQGIEPGDLVIHGMDGFAGAIGVSDSRGKGTPVLNVLDSKYDKRYLMYYFRTIAKCGYFESVATGIRVRTCDTNWNKISVTPCLVPPLSEQSRIAAFLDERCGKIDEAITKHKALIEKLDEYRKAVITKAVSKGVRGERKMKGSGVKWLPDIPVDWNIERTKFHFSNHKDIVGDNASEYERLALTLNGVIKRDKEDTDGLQPKEFGGYQILRQGELVFKLIDLENVSTSRVGYSPYTGIVSPAYIILEKKKGIEPRYAEYYYLSLWLREIFNQLGDSGVRSSLNSKDLLELPIAIPSPKEQSEIVVFLDKKCATIDSAKEHHLQLITKLEEYKKSLIYNAVTGKIEC